MIDAGLTCPNRDGTLSTKGCLFCDGRGSGTGAFARGVSPKEQLDHGLARAGRRAEKFVLYFQSFTNTYAPVDHLRPLWDLSRAHPDIVGLAIGTRPDCLANDVLDLLGGYAIDKEVWLELGLQSASDRTLARINRGHDAAAFADAVKRAQKKRLRTVAHVILGLPGEGEAEVLQTARFIRDLGVDGVKLHSLYISRGTGMADMLAAGEYEFLSQEEFVRLAVLFLEHIPFQMTVHRLTGDPDRETLIGPDWCLDKSKTIEAIRRRLERLDTRQGNRAG